nr:TetR family transcriptional regulator [Micromonospora chaiyaphumensis]
MLAAAERLFAERGPHISMTDLANAAGAGRATLCSATARRIRCRGGSTSCWPSGRAGCRRLCRRS